MKFIEAHFNALMAAMVFGGCFAVAAVAFHLHNDQFSAFAADQCKAFGGALLMALTGKGIATVVTSVASNDKDAKSQADASPNPQPKVP